MKHNCFYRYSLHINICFLAVLFLYPTFNCDCKVKRKFPKQYLATIELIIPGKIILGAESHEIVPLKTSNGLITFKNTGHSIGLENLILRPNLNNKVNRQIFSNRNISKEEDESGEYLVIPTSLLKCMHVRRKAKTGEGAVVGGGCEFGISGTATSGSYRDILKICVLIAAQLFA